MVEEEEGEEEKGEEKEGEEEGGRWEGCTKQRGKMKSSGW